MENEIVRLVKYLISLRDGQGIGSDFVAIDSAIDCLTDHSDFKAFREYNMQLLADVDAAMPLKAPTQSKHDQEKEKR